MLNPRTSPIVLGSVKSISEIFWHKANVTLPRRARGRKCLWKNVLLKETEENCVKHLQSVGKQ